MIEVFKMIRGTDKVNMGKLFCIDEDRRTKKYSLCLKIRSHVNSDIGLNLSLGELLINYWNPLTDEVVSCKSLSTFNRGNLNLL